MVLVSPIHAYGCLWLSSPGYSIVVRDCALSLTNPRSYLTILSYFFSLLGISMRISASVESDPKSRVPPLSTA